MLLPRNVAVILLAAGRSRRFGPTNKLLASFKGQPVVTHSAAMLATIGLQEMIAVCAVDGDDVAGVVEPYGFSIVRTQSDTCGMAHSLAMGVRTVSRSPSIEAVLVCLADMPNVTSTHVKRLMDIHDNNPQTAIASSNGIKTMPPALFGRDYFPALSTLQGDIGAKSFLQGAQLVCADDIVLMDIDCAEDLGH